MIDAPIPGTLSGIPHLCGIDFGYFMQSPRVAKSTHDSWIPAVTILYLGC